MRVNRKVCNAKLVATISLECRVHFTEEGSVRNHFLVSWVKIDISSYQYFVLLGTQRGGLRNIFSQAICQSKIS